MEGGTEVNGCGAWRWRRRLTILGMSMFGAAMIAWALPALAANPKSGCWVGPKTDCGGDVGPTHGAMFVQSGKVTGFLDELGCLGSFTEHFVTGPYKENYEVTLSKNISISRAGTFTYGGSATRTSKHGNHPVTIELSGKFVTKTKASISLTVQYGKCRPQKITMHLA